MSRHPAHVAAWEDLVLRLIAIYKFIKAAISIALGIGLLRIIHHNLSAFIMTWVIDPFHFDPESRFWAALLEQCSLITPHSLRLLSYGAFIYAAIFIAEGVGLYLRKHWAEYMVLISTGLLLPIEFYEIYLKLAWWKAGVVAGNLAILVYLIHRLWLDSQTEEDDEPETPAQVEDSPRGDSGRPVSKVR
jgi:uncharacterized membrane protein (DUF2068 family)